MTSSADIIGGQGGSQLFAPLSRSELAALGREYLLAGHLIDRAGMPQVLSAGFGRDVMRDLAIEEWMGASPVYTRRVQRALRFSGDDVATIFKGMQLDIGAPHEFMDFRYVVHNEHSGEFWLANCGALLDVEPLGEDFVVAVCHDIEDPTFDATAWATNPRARMRPVHRPPRRPADRHPHCRWLVTIESSAEPVGEPEAAVAVGASRAAAVELEIERPNSDRDPGGLSDYGGPFRPDFRLEDLSHAALVVAVQEVCLQGHLLAYAFRLAAERRFGTETAVQLATRQFTGIAGLVAERIARVPIRSNGEPAGGLDRVAAMLARHPAFHPRAYIDFNLVREGDHLMVWIGDCPALEELGGRSWVAVLAEGNCSPLDAAVRAVEPRAQCHPIDGPPDARLAWEIIDGGAPTVEASEVTLTKFSRGATFVFSATTR